MAISKDFHGGFSRFFDQPTRDTLRDLLKYGSGEANQFDFKEIWPEKHKIAKHILALANSGGGALIIGVKDNGDLEASGIPPGGKIDKTDVTKQVSAYLPRSLKFDILDFDYPIDSEYAKIKGKSFQVVIVNCDESELPYLCCKDHPELKSNVVYIRKRQESTEANHEDLQEVINRRLKSGASTPSMISLKEDLDQLKTLYKEMDSFSRLIPIESINRLLGYKPSQYAPEESLEEFVAELIRLKKEKIKRDLGISLS